MKIEKYITIFFTHTKLKNSNIFLKNWNLQFIMFKIRAPIC